MLANGYYDYIYVIEGGRKCCHMVMLSASVIVEARRRAGLSQRELALRLGKRQAEIARWERGYVVPSLERLREVVAACGLELTCGLAVADDSYDEQIVAGFSLPVGERLARVHRT